MALVLSQPLRLRPRRIDPSIFDDDDDIKTVENTFFKEKPKKEVIEAPPKQDLSKQDTLETVAELNKRLNTLKDLLKEAGVTLEKETIDDIIHLNLMVREVDTMVGNIKQWETRNQVQLKNS